MCDGHPLFFYVNVFFISLCNCSVTSMREWESSCSQTTIYPIPQCNLCNVCTAVYITIVYFDRCHFETGMLQAGWSSVVRVILHIGKRNVVSVNRALYSSTFIVPLSFRSSSGFFHVLPGQIQTDHTRFRFLIILVLFCIQYMHYS